MLERLSERVGPTGSLQGEGIANLLGRPPFDPLTLVLRESGQNIWDARCRNGKGGRDLPKMLVRVRTLDTRQAGVLQRLIQSGAEDEDEPAERNALRKRLSESGPVRVLEICDFGTIGLGGGTDPQGSQSRFVRFFFDFGSEHFDSGDGGTYGYGRSSLYQAGAAKTILVDTLTDDNERRFLGARIGNAYERTVQGKCARFTGRHFWGKVGVERRVEPVTGRAAEGLSRALGMPERPDGDSGTTILIPWADLPEAGSGERVAEILLHNFWPKLVSRSGPMAMEIEVEEEGISVPVPDPKGHPSYGLFAAALLTARTRDERRGAQSTRIRNTKVTGHLAFAQSLKAPLRRYARDAELFPETIFDAGVGHVALMRPSELVVRYLEFPGMGEDHDWAGVFLCSDAPDVVRAFASSEPPAHDDWVPDRLTGEGATWVRATKQRRIPEFVRARYGPAPVPDSVAASPQVSLASAADSFAQRFIAGDGTAPGHKDRSGGGGGGGGSRTFKALEFVKLRAEGNRRIAQFRTALANGASMVALRGSAVVDGLGKDEILPEGMHPPEILGWVAPDGSRRSGAECKLSAPGNYVLEVAFHGDYAIHAWAEEVRN